MQRSLTPTHTVLMCCRPHLEGVDAAGQPGLRRHGAHHWD